MLIEAVSQSFLLDGRAGPDLCQGYDVHAVDINEGDALKSLGCKTSRLDVTSEESIHRFKHEYGDGPLDLLLNVAGTLVPVSHALVVLFQKTVGKKGPPKDKRKLTYFSSYSNSTGIMDPDHDALSTVTKDSLTHVFAVNTFGPLLLTQALLPNVLKSSSTSTRLAFVSSRVGSIADNSTGGNYAYRSSKTALNQICKNLAIELKDKGVVVSILHPGIVKTNILPTSAAGPGPEAINPDEAAGKLFKVLSSKGIEDTGKFWHREGYELPW